MKLLKKANGNLPRTEEEKERMIEEASKHYANFLQSLGFDYLEDDNSKDTPRRVAKSWVRDIASGCFNEEPNITSFDNTEGYDGLVCQTNIDVVSLCSHHNLPFVGKAHVAYIPSKDGKVIGLSKINRVVDFFARRPQLQEALTMQIHDFISSICKKNNGVAVVIEAMHTCCSNRGIKHSSTMRTAKLSGCFLDNLNKSRDEFYNFIKR